MSRYYIEDLKVGMSNGGMACGPVPGVTVGAVKFRKDDLNPKWLYCIEAYGFPEYYLTDEDLLETIIDVENDSEDDHDEFREKLEACKIEEFDGVYLDSFVIEDEGNPAVPLLRCLIAIMCCPIEVEDDLKSTVIGKDINDVYDDFQCNDIDESSYYLCFSSDNAVTDKEQLYKRRLAAESRVDEFEDTYLQLLKQKCEDEDAYQNWKAEYITQRYDVLKDVPFATCSYLVAGVEDGVVILPKCQLDIFRAMIDGMGAGFMGEPEDASEDDVRTYIGSHAYPLKNGNYVISLVLSLPVPMSKHME